MNVLQYCSENPTGFREDLVNGKIKVSVHGQGYVGLPLSVLLAKAGIKVVGTVTKKEKAEKLMRGTAPFHETDPNSLLKLGAQELPQKCPIDGIKLFRYEGQAFCPVCLRSYSVRDSLPMLSRRTVKLPKLKTLDDYLKEAIQLGNYTVTTDNVQATKDTDIHIIIVPTFADNYQIVLDVAKDIAKGLKDGDVIINKSTVPVGATDEAEEIIRKNTDKEFGICHMQERIAEGRALKEFVDLPRTVGSRNQKANEVAKGLFEFLGSPVYCFDSPRITEASKIFENAYRDCNIAIANNFALFCEENGLDVYQVIASANTNYKTNIFQPGMIGGHCLPEDTYYVAEPMKHLNELNTIMSGRKLNEYVPVHIVELVEEGLKKLNLNSCDICLFGVAFKGNTDDTRSSGAKVIADLLKSKGLAIYVYDPWVPEEEQKKFGIPCSLEEGLNKDCIVVATDHTQFYDIDYSKSRARLIVDARNVVKKAEGKMVYKFGCSR